MSMMDTSHRKSSSEKRLHHWRHRRVFGRAWRVALVVGSVLNLINHYNLMFGTPIDISIAIQMVLTYLVPYLVSTHGQVSAHLDNVNWDPQR